MTCMFPLLNEKSIPLKVMRVASQENRRLRSWRIVIVHAEALSYAAPHTLPCRATAGYLNKDDIKVAVTALLGAAQYVHLALLVQST